MRSQNGNLTSILSPTTQIAMRQFLLNLIVIGGIYGSVPVVDARQRPNNSVETAFVPDAVQPKDDNVKKKMKVCNRPCKLRKARQRKRQQDREARRERAQRCPIYYGLRYLGETTEQCKRLKIRCFDDERYFSARSNCGCGCHNYPVCSAHRPCPTSVVPLCCERLAFNECGEANCNGICLPCP